MKYLLIMTTSENVMNFRSSMIKFLLRKGHSVSVIAHDKKREADIKKLGVQFHCVSQNNRGLNPFSIVTYYKRLSEIIKKEAPDVLLTYQLKPNIFGVLSGHKNNVKSIHAMVEGLGDVYTKTGLKWASLRFVVNILYRVSFKKATGVFFLNNEDKEEFTKRKLVDSAKCTVIHGIGVDLEKFAFSNVKNTKKFIMIARMLETKGVYEYCKCARLVKSKYPDAVFGYLGAEGTVKLSDIQEYIDDGSIEYYGTTRDVRPYLKASLLLLLSSYREGCPASIMEAEAVGRAVITSNSVGCKDTVVDGYNGFLVDKNDYKEMAKKVIWCIEHPEKTKQMGENARAFAEEHFDAEKINETVYAVCNKAYAPVK